jgi:hypothetical protein
MRAMTRSIVVAAVLVAAGAPGVGAQPPAGAETRPPAVAPPPADAVRPAQGDEPSADRGGVGFKPVDEPAPGWNFTPSLAYGGNWDDNVLIQESGDPGQGDYESAISPAADLLFIGRRSSISAGYNGSFIRYQDLSSLDSFDQHAAVSASRAVTKHVTIEAGNSLNISPTTELADLAGVPFLRTGSRVDDLRGRISVDLSKRMSMAAGYSFQWVSFDTDPVLGVSLLGGHSHGLQLSVARHLNERLSLTGDYNLQHAIVADADGFNIHNAWGGAEYQLSREMTLAGAFGVSRLGVSQLAPARTGPAWRASLSRQFTAAQLTIAYIQSYVPSYSFGGTLQNEEASGRVLLPLGRRASVESALSWRKNDPLDPGGIPLKAFLTNTSVAYVVTPWLSVAGFYDGAFQRIDRDGGQVNRSRVGFQIITSKPMRVR